MLYDLGLLAVGRPSWKVQALGRKNTSRDVLVETAVLLATPGFSAANVWRMTRGKNKIMWIKRNIVAPDDMVVANVNSITKADAENWIHRLVEYYAEGAVGIPVWSFRHLRDERRAGVTIDALASRFKVPRKRISKWLNDGKSAKRRVTSY